MERDLMDDKKRPLIACRGCPQKDGCRNIKCQTEFECLTYKDRKKGIERHTLSLAVGM
ncbi:unnamed protein product [marine sediment metagenome]|uniref:Uncharacterized protein n=1 Tax=marine sediment metagenome TaxID=412755 RepID=X0U9Q5_9ZZZZ